MEESIFEICIFDRKTLGFIHANKRARENLGYSMKVLAGLTVFDVKKELDHARFDSMIERLRNGKVDKIE